MKRFSRPWWRSHTIAICVCIILTIVILSVAYFRTGQGDKIAPLIGGLLTGLILVFIQYLFSWHEHIERENFRLLGLKRVLKHKRDPKFYGQLIKGSKKRIYLMGRTARHFLEDFANTNGAHKEANFLLEALGRNVEVRFILPHPDHLSEDSKSDGQDSGRSLAELASKFTCFRYKYLRHQAYHSVFVADDNVIIGPYFPELASMDTPALHLKSSANIPQKYLEYFQQEWDQCPDPD